jgi:signal peptidase II
MVRKVERRQGWADVAFGLVLGGAVGNIADRVYLGRVVDFVVMHWQRKAVWPAYNVADAALVVGVAMLILVLGRKPEARPARPAQGKRR